MILIYDVNDGIWESKGNFQTAKEDNDDITIQPTNDGKYNLDILCVSLPFIYIILSENFVVILQCLDLSICRPPSCCPSPHTFASSNFYSHCFRFWFWFYVCRLSFSISLYHYFWRVVFYSKGFHRLRTWTYSGTRYLYASHTPGPREITSRFLGAVSSRAGSHF